MTNSLPIIGIVGGTGALGSALGFRWARAGYPVILGSRDAQKAQARAHQLTAGVGQLDLTGASNADAVARAACVVVTVPWSAQESALSAIRAYVGDKIVVVTTVPLVPPKVARVQLPPEGSAAVRAQNLLGAEARVVAGFHNVAAHKLAQAGDVDCDVLVFGDDKQAREQVIALAEAAGLRGLHGGPLVNSAAAEALTSVLIFLNKTYGIDGAGIRITGAPGEAMPARLQSYAP